MKRFNIMYNVGSAKYVVNFHDGVKTHKDGSEFWDIHLFNNKRKGNAFIKSLLKAGYTSDYSNPFI